MTRERDRTTDERLSRIRGEFLEMPGMRLTGPQAQRLWGLDAAACEALLDMLVDAGFLVRTSDGAVMRAEQRTGAKASLRMRHAGAA